MTTLTIEQGSSTELVSNAVIQKLYNIASNSTNVTLTGNLQCECCYQYVYDYFTGNVAENVRRFPNLSLTVTNGRYINFADPEITKYWADSTYGDGVGLNANSAPSISTFPKRLTEAGRSVFTGMMLESDISTSWLRNGCYAFYKDKNVTSFNELGQFSNITTIPTSMFRESALKYIDLSNIINIEAAAFCAADLTGVVNLPKFKQWGGRSVSTSVNMDYQYFSGNANMTEIHIGADVSDEDKITSVPRFTFQNCSSLSEVTGLNMVTNIGDSAFKGCSSLENIQDLNDTTAIIIGNNSFQSCTSLKCIDLTNINYLREYSFDGCSNLTALDTNDLDHINDNTEYTFSIDILERYAFRNTGLNGKTLKFTNINSIPISAFEGSGLNKFIGTNVTTLEGSAFKNCAQLQEVQLGNITTINTSVFNNCSNLTTIKFGNLTNDFSNITSIGDYAFDGCSSLSSISNLTDIQNIGKYSFRNCGINQLSLPSLTSIGSCAFYGCTGIQSVTDLGQIKNLPSDCFQNCTNLTSIIIPGTVDTVTLRNFNTSAMQRLIIREGTTRVSMSEVSTNNGTYRYIEIPSTVTAIWYMFNSRVFKNEPSSSIIYVMKPTDPPVDTMGNVIDTSTVQKYSKIYVPDGSYNTYINSDVVPWNNSAVKNKIAPISQLETDNPTYWAVYQSGLYNSQTQEP